MVARALSSILVLLTSDCNLRCAYCYENLKKSGRMGWGILRAATELALGSGRSGVTIAFSGGEPLLEFPLLRRAVTYIRQKAPPRKRVKLLLITNGTMLDEEKILFLAKNGFDIQLSFDGVRAVQDFRGKDTFESLNRLLDVLSERHPHLYRSHLAVSMTVTPRAVPHLAESVEYFLSKRVERLEISTSIVDCSDWRREAIEGLERQFSRVVNASLVHFRGTGKIPLTLFRNGRTSNGGARNGPVVSSAAWIPGTSRPMCRVMRGNKLAVDPDGEAFACATLAASCQRFPSELLRRTAETARIGNIRSRKFLENRARFLKDVQRAEIFYRKEDKYSSYCRCSDCRYFEACGVCPVSIGHIPGNEDPNRIPDFGCAFTFTAGKYREQFARRAFARNKLTGG